MGAPGRARAAGAARPLRRGAQLLEPPADPLLDRTGVLMSVPRAITWGVVALTLLFVAVAAALLLLNSWNPGQRAVLDYAVGRIQGSIEGTVTVDSVESRSLLR